MHIMYNYLAYLLNTITLYFLHKIDIGLSYYMVMQIHIATESHRTLSTRLTNTHGWHTAWG